MWIYLNNAFVSCVEHKHDPSSLLIRTRKKGDLEELFPGVSVQDSVEDFDYRFRATLPRGEVSEELARRVMQIDYPKFKNSIREIDRKMAYTKCWSKMLDWQLDSANKDHPGDK